MHDPAAVADERGWIEVELQPLALKEASVGPTARISDRKVGKVDPADE